MTDTLEEIVYEPVASPIPGEVSAELYTLNLKAVDEAYGSVRTDLTKLTEAVEVLKKRPPRPHRTGAAARANPDDIRIYRVILVGTLIFALAAFAASFNAQYQMAPYTRLQPGFWWLIPLFIEMPLAVFSFAVLVFKRRGESVLVPWVVMIGLTALASTINIAHVVIESGMLEFGDWIGATIMGLVPILILVAFKEFARLAVKPTVDTPVPPAPVKKAAKK